jgi:hypothetical protein
MARYPACLLVICLLQGCSSLLPRSQVVSNSPWQSFQEAQRTFEKIIPGKTTFADLRHLQLDPESNPNMTILNYSDVLRRFVVGPSMQASDLDSGVKECLAAKTVCSGYEVDQRMMVRQRNGNFFADFTNFRRATAISGWRFNGLLLVKDNVVVYKLTGGQPVIQEQEESSNPLGPFQGVGESMLGRYAP